MKFIKYLFVMFLLTNIFSAYSIDIDDPDLIYLVTWNETTYTDDGYRWSNFTYAGENYRLWFDNMVVSPQMSGVNCKTDSCYNLNGASQKILLFTPDPQSGFPSGVVPSLMDIPLVNNQNFSYSIWFNPDTLTSGSHKYIINDLNPSLPSSSSQIMLSFGILNPTNFGFQNIRDYVGIEEDDYTLFTPTIITSSWQNYVLTYDATNYEARSYLNGVLVDSANITNTNEFFETARYTFIGSEGDGNSNFFDGRIDDFFIINRMLSNTEVLDYYTNGFNYNVGSYNITLVDIVDGENVTISNSGVGITFSFSQDSSYINLVCDFRVDGEIIDSVSSPTQDVVYSATKTGGWTSGEHTYAVSCENDDEGFVLSEQYTFNLILNVQEESIFNVDGFDYIDLEDPNQSVDNTIDIFSNFGAFIWNIAMPFIVILVVIGVITFVIMLLR